jgi:membrane protease YdiL (CAAX protease family)
MVSAFFSALLQVGLVLVIAGIVYLIFGRRSGPFGRFVGLQAAPPRAILIGIAVGIASAAAILAFPGVAEMNAGRGTVTGEAARQGVSADMLAGLAIAALIKTSFSEELLFRGLIGKRLIARLGFQAGNLIQAVLFGAVHLLLLLVPSATTGVVIFIVLVTGALGWVNGWLNERLGSGSILPGWAAHATANFCAYFAMALAIV